MMPITGPISPCSGRPAVRLRLKSWTIVQEQEVGVSGHKVRVESRDKLQIIREHALQGRFNIMPDRTGRIADEWI